MGFVPLAIFLIQRLFNVPKEEVENNYEGETIATMRMMGRKTPYREIYPACVLDA